MMSESRVIRRLLTSYALGLFSPLFCPEAKLAEKASPPHVSWHLDAAASVRLC